jgi:hypothetical protein
MDAGGAFNLHHPFRCERGDCPSGLADRVVDQSSGYPQPEPFGQQVLDFGAG